MLTKSTTHFSMNQQQRHFYLSAMGITIWQQRGKEHHHNNTQPTHKHIHLSQQTITHHDVSKNQHRVTVNNDGKPSNVSQPSTPSPSTDTSAPSPPNTAKTTSQNAKSDHTETNIDYATLDWVTLNPAIETCQQCVLAKSRNQAIVGTGSHTASLMIIGDAPADDEDRQGLPFAGKTEQLLNNMLNAIDIKTQDIYITNLIKCRPPNNRTPKKHELNQCNGFIQQQIKLIQPDLILVVGRVAAQYLLNSKNSLTQLRNTMHILPPHNIPVIATYHPAYLLRQTSTKAKTWEDLKKVRKQLIHLRKHH